MLFFFLSFLFDFPFETEDCELIWLLGSVINPLWSSHTGWCRWLQTDSVQALSVCSLVNFNLQPILMLIWVSEIIWSLGLDISLLSALRLEWHGRGCGYAAASRLQMLFPFSPFSLPSTLSFLLHGHRLKSMCLWVAGWHPTTAPAAYRVSKQSPSKPTVHKPHQLSLQEQERLPCSPPLQTHSGNWWLAGAAQWGFPDETGATAH